MKAIDLIRNALTFTDEGFAALVADLRHHPLAQPTATGGNHALWILGHLCYLEGSLRYFILDEPNPVEHYEPLFGTGSQPALDAALYPTFDELLAQFRSLRAGTIRMLDQVGEADLDRRPPNVPAGFESAMATIGQTFLLIALHQMVHYGQAAVVRRSLGLKPLI